MTFVVVVVGVNKEVLVDVESWSEAAEAAMTAHEAARQLFESKWRVDIFSQKKPLRRLMRYYWNF